MGYRRDRYQSFQELYEKGGEEDSWVADVKRYEDKTALTHADLLNDWVSGISGGFVGEDIDRSWQ